MKVENNYPKFFIVVEPKLNVNSFENFLKEISKNDLTALNSFKKIQSQQIGDVEKIYLIIQEVFKNTLYESLINSFLHRQLYVSVIFSGVSQCFSNVFFSFSGEVEFFQLNKENINLWLPSFLENEKEVAYEIGKSMVDYVQSMNNLKNELISKYKHLYQERKISEIFSYITPNAVTGMLLVTGSIHHWKKFIVKHTDYDSLDEIRYILMHLLRLFKMKWNFLFDDIMLCDSNGQPYSIDNLVTNESSYQKFCVRKIKQ